MLVYELEWENMSSGKSVNKKEATKTFSTQPITKKLIIASVAVGVAIFVLIFLFTYGLGGFTFTHSEAKPEPTISWDGHETFEGLKRLYVIDVTVGNKGAAGYVKVFASVDSLRQEKLIYLQQGELTSLQFVFDISSKDPIGPLGSSAWAEAA